jgi:N-methylhydantoinase A
MFVLDIGRDYVRSYLTKSTKADLAHVNKLFDDMVTDAVEDVKAFDVSADELVFDKSCEMRYAGQYHVLEIDLPEKEITEEDIRQLEERFHDVHQELFTFSLRWVPMEIINLRLTAKLKSSKLAPKRIAEGKEDPAKALIRTHQAWFGGKELETPVYDGTRLLAGNLVKGNAIIEEPTSTTVIPVGHACMVDAYGNYLIGSTK